MADDVVPDRLAEIKANPKPLPGLAHDFHCTHEPVLCACWAAEVERLRAELRAQVADWDGAWHREHAAVERLRSENAELVGAALVNGKQLAEMSALVHARAEIERLRVAESILAKLAPYVTETHTGRLLLVTAWLDDFDEAEIAALRVLSVHLGEPRDEP